MDFKWHVRRILIYSIAVGDELNARFTIRYPCKMRKIFSLFLLRCKIICVQSLSRFCCIKIHNLGISNIRILDPPPFPLLSILYMDLVCKTCGHMAAAPGPLACPSRSAQPPLVAVLGPEIVLT